MSNPSSFPSYLLLDIMTGLKNAVQEKQVTCPLPSSRPVWIKHTNVASAITTILKLAYLISCIWTISQWNNHLHAQNIHRSKWRKWSMLTEHPMLYLSYQTWMIANGTLLIIQLKVFLRAHVEKIAYIFSTHTYI